MVFGSVVSGCKKHLTLLKGCFCGAEKGKRGSVRKKEGVPRPETFFRDVANFHGVLEGAKFGSLLDFILVKTRVTTILSVLAFEKDLFVYLYALQDGDGIPRVREEGRCRVAWFSS